MLNLCNFGAILSARYCGTGLGWLESRNLWDVHVEQLSSNEVCPTASSLSSLALTASTNAWFGSRSAMK
jgi:hypothetical protein